MSLYNKHRKSFVKPEDKIWFGKYKGTMMADVPLEYFQWLIQSKSTFRSIKHYCKTYLNLTK